MTQAQTDTRTQLANLLSDPDFRTLEAKARVFCPFEAIGMVDQEIRHAHFLAYILDPNRPHGFGDTMWMAFLEEVLEAYPTSQRPHFDRLNLIVNRSDYLRVRREWRNIDLLFEMPMKGKKTQILAVEMKVNANETKGQLDAYKEIVERQFPSSKYDHTFIFLTIAGKRSFFSKSWVPMAWDALVERFETALELQHINAQAANYLRAYCAMMRRHHLVDKQTEEAIKQIWQNHREVLTLLNDKEPSDTSAIMQSIEAKSLDIAEILSKLAGFEVKPDKDGKDHHGYLSFSVPRWDKIQGLKLKKANGPNSGRALRIYVNDQDSPQGSFETFGHVFTTDSETLIELHKCLKDVRKLAPSKPNAVPKHRFTFAKDFVHVPDEIEGVASAAKSLQDSLVEYWTPRLKKLDKLITKHFS